jgi:DNA polymerase
MSWKKFIDACKSWKIDISQNMAQKVVAVYREKYSKIKDFWYATERKAIEAINNPNCFIANGKMKWLFVRGNLYAILPSGRRITYNQARLKMEEGPYGLKETIVFKTYKLKKWVDERTYGGKLVENITQGVARDILTDSMFELEKHNYGIIMHVHDEVIILSKENLGSIEEVEKIMSKIPQWAKGLPLAAEGWRGKYYKK